MTTRDRILGTSLDLFGTRGVDAVSLDEIARAVGVRKQTVLYWFASKDDLVDEVLLACVDSDAERIAASQLVDKKLRAMGSGRPVDRDTATRRLVGMLARKGYNSSVAYSVVRERLDSAELRDEQR